MTAVVRVEFDGDVAVVLIDNPPINAGSQAVRQGLLDAIEAANSAADVVAVVLMGAGSTFIAGADLREFGHPLADPQLPTVIAAIENCGKPVLAALHGAALGGGFELALGCDARVALVGTVLGLPEVTLGIIPGAGGTQRLPRLTGIPRAIRMICSGERVGAEVALSLGLIDSLVQVDLRRESVSRARGLPGCKSKLIDRPVPEADEGEIAKASADALRAGRNRPAVKAAIEVILQSGTLPSDQALARERTAFQSLRTSREARALRYQFFAEREAAKVPALESAQVRAVQKLAVVGAGTMGSGIAIAALDAGFDVALLERDEPDLQRGLERIRAYYRNRVETQKLTAAQGADRVGRLQASLDWSVVSTVDLIIEAVFEDIAVKQDVFKRLGTLARPGAILASNTSYTDLDAIAAVTLRPQDVVGLHFFSPAQVMRLLEVVRGAKTAPDVLATSLMLAKRLRKVAVVSANAFGFIGNRVYAAYRRQCEFLLEEGASPQQVDTALEGFGFAMGPFAVGDMSGLDIAWRMRQSQASTRGPTARYVQIPDLLCESGRLGQKSGAGYYFYGAPGGKRQPDPAVDRLIVQARAVKGLVPRELGNDEIVTRALLAIVNEVALLLAQGVAQRVGDVDVVMVNGYGFPKWEGGPVFWARERGAAALAQDLAWLAEVSGPGFVPGDVRHLFDDVART